MIKRHADMTILIDYGILIPFVISLFFWIRGIWKKNKGDLFFGGALLIVSNLFYAVKPALSPISGLPWISLLLFAVATIASLFSRKKHKLTWRFIIIAGVCLILSLVCFSIEKKWEGSSNSMLVIAPYRHAGTWVFDDPRVGLKAEPFVLGIPELIDKLVADANISLADSGFRLIFSPQPFPEHQTKVIWRRRELGGNWYYSEKYDMEGWLCPALFKYFRKAPKEIYIKVEAK
jgi:hypothetical protein